MTKKLRWLHLWGLFYVTTIILVGFLFLDILFVCFDCPSLAASLDSTSAHDWDSRRQKHTSHNLQYIKPYFIFHISNKTSGFIFFWGKFWLRSKSWFRHGWLRGRLLYSCCLRVQNLQDWFIKLTYIAFGYFKSYLCTYIVKPIFFK